MKKFPKNLLDEVINQSRQYWESGEEELLYERIHSSQEIENITKVDWLAVLDLIDSIIRGRGFLPDAENDEIYSVLRILGWEVTDNGEMEHPAR